MLPPTDLFEFTVEGRPQQGGSKEWRPDGRGGINIIDANPRAKDWMGTVGWEARKAMVGRRPFVDAVVLEIDFYMPRPKANYGTGRNAGVVKASAPLFHTVEPDATKLTRSTEDGLKGIVWRDDSQVVEQRIRKLYADGRTPCAVIRVYARV